MALLNADEIKHSLAELNGWQQIDNSIIKEYEFGNFTNAVSFVVGVGIEAEKMDHHPDIFLHSWNKVKITLSTHSKGGITELDIKLAGIIEKLF